MTKNKDYGRFYALLKRNPSIEKDDIVMQFTDGRTTHLHEMKAAEYIEMCDAIEGKPRTSTVDLQELKRARSSVLLRIGRLGISTIDNWAEIDQFCQSPKIAGKKFAQMDIDELKALVKKLESIQKAGGLKWIQERQKQEEEQKTDAYLQMAINAKGKANTNPKLWN